MTSGVFMAIINKKEVQAHRQALGFRLNESLLQFTLYESSFLYQAVNMLDI